MYTNSGTPYDRRIRQAEHADTRLGIRRHDPDQNRKGHQDESPRSEGFLYEDNASVSVEALIVFLQSLTGDGLAERTDRAPAAPGLDNAAPQTVSSSQNRPAQDRPTGRSAHAAQAYAQTARAGALAPPIQNSAAASLPGLTESDLHSIHRLIGELKSLAQAGVEFLTIEREESFLQSLSSAAQKARAARADRN
jgi:hypothetical protein